MKLKFNFNSILQIISPPQIVSIQDIFVKISDMRAFYAMQFLKFCNLHLIFCVCSGTFLKNEKANRNISLDHTLKGQKMTGTPIKIQIGIKKQTGCATLCLHTAECKSFNYCNGRICELNSNDFHSLGANTEMVEEPECVYGGMSIEEQPHCVEASNPIDIKETYLN